MHESDLTEMLPSYYRESRLTSAINGADAQELTRLDEKLRMVKRQFFVSTADTSLARWEKEVGIPESQSPDMELRRASALSRLRGAETITLQFVEQLAERMTGINSKIIELPAEYRFKIRLGKQISRLPRLKELTAVLEDLKPAHLAYIYVLQLATPQNAAAKAGAFTSVAQRITVYPYMPPSVEVESKLSVQSYVSTAVKITVGGI